MAGLELSAAFWGTTLRAEMEIVAAPRMKRKGVVSGGAQQAEPEECEASQNLERKRARGGLNLSQPQDGDGDGGTDNCLRLAFVLRVLKQRSVPDKAEHARAQNKALCEHNALGAGE